MARVLVAAAALVAAACSSSFADQAPRPNPNVLAEVPAAFHGGWDELSGCENREPRFSISASHFYNFEIVWRVKEVRLHSPTEIEIVTILEDPDPVHGASAQEAEEIWSLRLVDGGRAIAPRGHSEPLFLRCNDTLGRG